MVLPASFECRWLQLYSQCKYGKIMQTKLDANIAGPAKGLKSQKCSFSVLARLAWALVDLR